MATCVHINGSCLRRMSHLPLSRDSKLGWGMYTPEFAWLLATTPRRLANRPWQLCTEQSLHQFQLLCIPLLWRSICNNAWIARKKSSHLLDTVHAEAVQVAHSFTCPNGESVYCCPPTWRLAAVAKKVGPLIYSCKGSIATAVVAEI